MLSLATLAARTPVIQTTSDEELAALAVGGDDLALNELLVRYRPYVRGKAKNYFVTGGDREDVIQEGMIGLYKAVRDFDATRQPSFRGFADLCITRQIISAIKSATRRKHSPLNRAVPLSSPYDDDGESVIGRGITAPDADPADRVVSRADLERLRAYCAEQLSVLEREVLTRYARGECYAEIATAVGRHVKAVDNALQRTKRKLEAYAAGLIEVNPA